jgi:hypothetical protein
MLKKNYHKIVIKKYLIKKLEILANYILLKNNIRKIILKIIIN